MPRFTYSAIDGVSGKERRGVLEGGSPAQAAAELKAQGLYPTALVVEPAAGADVPVGDGTEPGRFVRARSRGWLRRRRMSRKARVLFTRQLATLVRAGMPLLRGLEALARQERDAGGRAMIEHVAETIRSGGTLSDGLLQYPATFDRLYVNMVRAGEASGALDVVLDRLAQFLEKAERTRGKVKAAMTYPVIIMIVAAGIVGGLMLFVIPKFETIFHDLLKGQALPPLTQAVLAVSTFVRDHVLLTAAAAAAAYATLVLLRRTRGGTRVFDWLALHLPVFGDLGLKASVARFTRTFGTLLASGVPILQALRITRDTSGNVFVAGALEAAHDRVKAGETLARPLASATVLPPMVASMIDVGEETGALPEMLARIADTYDEEVDNAVAALTSLIEPVMIVIMAVLVGTIVLSLFLPIIRIIQLLS